jgi:hypothetical protein
MTLKRRIDEMLDANPCMTWMEALQVAANEKREDPFLAERQKHLTCCSK